MAVGNPSKRIVVRDTASSDLAGQVVTTSEATLGVKIGAYKEFGFWVDISAISGTSPTLDIQFQWSEDSTNGVDGTWADLVENVEGSNTQAALAQITTVTGAYGKFFVHPASNKGWIRAYFKTGGVAPSYTVDNAYWVAKDAASHGR